MGTMHHHALIVTSWNEDVIADAHRFASEISPHTSPIIKADVNDYASFAVLPDGSKEGWGASDTGDAARFAIIEWIDAKAYEDGSNQISWCEASFGELENTLRSNEE